MSTLKVNKLRDTSGSTDAITLDPNGGAVLAGVTTVTSVKVGAAVTISESGIEASGIGITCANINGAQIGGRRNMIINGAMQVAQRGTSFTASGSYPVDRFRIDDGGHDELSTKEQAAVTSGGAYDSGFRNCLKLTNGNQTGGAGASDYIQILYRFEAQDIANSGWNYPSTSSFVTLSFWVKSSVAQVFSGSLRTVDGTAYSYKFDTPSLSANTWTKVTKTIPGNSNLTFADDANNGLQILIYPFIGTGYTNDGSATETWVTAGNTWANNMTSTWWTTNDATFELTGVQLEVGSQATSFEHRSFGEELQLCSRYFQQFEGGSNSLFATGFTATNDFYGGGTLPMGKMRAAPTIAVDGTLSHLNYTHVGVARDVSAITNQGSGDTSFVVRLQSVSTTTDNAGAYARIINSSTNLTFDAEI